MMLKPRVIYNRNNEQKMIINKNSPKRLVTQSTDYLYDQQVDTQQKRLKKAQN